jgi:SAM-dependent methyltransferase
MDLRPGFSPDQLRARYNVESFEEDEWHTYAGCKTRAIIRRYASLSCASSRLLLNAGAGVYELNLQPWEEVSVDLFAAPLRAHRRGVCANIENLPFDSAQFGAVVCVGEVLGYCDPARAITEFSRVISPGGVLICDFGNSRSFRYWALTNYGLAAAMIKDVYNDTIERVWVYDPQYIRSLLTSSGFSINHVFGTHGWSALTRRVGASSRSSVYIQNLLDWLPAPVQFSDVMTIVAVRCEAAK